jgi:hypothetical protein
VWKLAQKDFMEIPLSTSAVTVIPHAKAALME